MRDSKHYKGAKANFYAFISPLVFFSIYKNRRKWKKGRGGGRERERKRWKQIQAQQAFNLIKKKEMYNLYTIDHSIHPSFMMVPDKQPFSYTENHDMDLLLTSGYHPTTTVAAPTPAPLTVATHLPMSMTIPCTDDLFMPNDLKSNMDYSTSQFDFLSLSQNELFYNGPMYWTTPTMHIHRHSLPDNDSSVESCSSLSSFSSGSPVSSPLFYEKPKHNKYSTDNNRPYSCHLCPRAFARKHDLQRHIRVHTGDKPYACPCCKKAFARTDALKRHLRVEEQCRKSQEVQAMKAAGRRRYKNI